MLHPPITSVKLRLSRVCETTTWQERSVVDICRWPTSSFTMKRPFPVASAKSVAYVWRKERDVTLQPNTSFFGIPTRRRIVSKSRRFAFPVERVDHLPLLLHWRIQTFRLESFLSIREPSFIKELLPPGVERIGVESDGARPQPQMRNPTLANQGSEGRLADLEHACPLVRRQELRAWPARWDYPQSVILLGNSSLPVPRWPNKRPSVFRRFIAALQPHAFEDLAFLPKRSSRQMRDCCSSHDALLAGQPFVLESVEQVLTTVICS